MAAPNRKFETERTRKFRAGPLHEADERTITHIETYGCSIVQVGSTCSDEGPGWSYTIGIYDTCGKPEIIEVGLRFDTAHGLLNQAATRLRSGIDLSIGRHRDLVGEVDCEFRPVDPKWVKRLMGWARWYYDGDDFPVLQAVYPDRENRYPEDPGFDSYFRQPLLQSGAPMTDLENAFWNSADPGSKFSDWKFPDPPHTKAFLSEAVHTEAEPVTYVSHDAEDGAWQFLGDGMAGDSKPVISCLHHPIDKDPSLKELSDLPLGWWAERVKPGESWTRHQHQPEEEDSTPAPNLKFLHADSTLNRVKLDLFRRLATSELKSSLAPGQQGSLKVRADGTVLDGHHRLKVLAERGEDIHRLPREIMEKARDES